MAKLEQRLKQYASFLQRELGKIGGEDREEADRLYRRTYFPLEGERLTKDDLDRSGSLATASTMRSTYHTVLNQLYEIFPEIKPKRNKRKTK